MARIREIRKRDNRIVPFDQSKIGDAIYKAVRSVGAGDAALANDLAAAVTLFLEKQFSGAIPSIEDIQDMVETVLKETGHSEIAAAYIEYREKRSKIRRILQVHKEAPQGPAVETGSRPSTRPWRKANIVAALVKEADLDVPVAEEVAGAVEEKVFRSELRRISTSLIRELVDNELFERGYAAKLKRQAPIGFPKYNLEQVIFSADAKEPYSFAKDPEDTERVVAQYVLRQYALEEIHSSEVGEAQRDNRIVIHRLGEPLRLHRINLTGDLVSAALFSDENVSLRFLRILRAVGTEVRVPYPKTRTLLRELGVLAYRTRSIAVVAAGDTALPAVPGPDDPAAALRYYAALDPDTPPPRRLLHDAASYYASGCDVRFVVGHARQPALVPAKISLNLPQLAIRSGRTRLGDLEGEVDHALSLAIKALLERRSFLGRAARATDLPLWELVGKDEGLFDLSEATFSIGIFGLADAVKFMTGREAFQDPETFRKAVDLLTHISRKVSREARGIGLRLRLEETVLPRILEESARQDARRFPELAEILRGRQSRPVYTAGVRLPRQAPLDPLTRNRYLARLFPFIELGGIVEEDPELRSGGEDVLVSLLEESLPLFSGSAGGAPPADSDALDANAVGSVEEK